MIEQLDDSDWAEVFGEGDGGNCTTLKPQPQPPIGWPEALSLATFVREDVAEIYGIEAGERDGPDWIVYGRLQDGRYFAARGGCDYTGWDCQASNSSDVALTRQVIEQYGLSDDERQRLGIWLS